MNKKLIRAVEPSLKVYFVFLLIFGAAMLFFQPWLGIAMLVIVLLLYINFLRSRVHRRKEILKYIEGVTYNVDTATKDTMMNAPLPLMILKPDVEEVVWANDRFLDITGEREHIFDVSLSKVLPDFSCRWLIEGKSEYPQTIVVGEREYAVYGHLIRPEQGARGLLAATYWVDVTEFAAITREYKLSRPVLGILMLDNYEELMKGQTDTVRSNLMAAVDEKINQWASPANGFLCKYDRDRYIFLFEERYLQSFLEGKFALLDSVRSILGAEGIYATVSIGIGKDGGDFGELFQFASLAIDMALSRGGDQAVIKNRAQFEFYGGRAKETEKRTKVKSRVMANALGELMADSSQIFVMGHKMSDLDSLGAAAGIIGLARKKGKPAYLVLDPERTAAADMLKKLMAAPEYAPVLKKAQDAVLMADARSLLVVVDTSRPEQTESEALLQSCPRVAVIDHHRRAATYISNAALNFHEPYASSASELVTELLQYLTEPSDLLRVEMEALLAGIVLDTKNFSMRTGARTFDAAAYLRRCGADTAEVKKLFQNDLNSAVTRYNIVRTAEMVFPGIALAAAEETVSRVTLAQAADELLNIAGVKASFVVGPIGPEDISISARSLDDINVQVILEALGGGGNANTAGAAFKGASVDHVRDLLLHAIDQYQKDQ